MGRCAQVFFVPQYQIGLHGGAESIDVTVCMLTRQCIVVFSQGVVVLVIDKALAQVAIARVATASIGQEEILRQGVGLIPRVGNRLVRAGFLFRAAERFFGKMGENSVGSALQ